jgi:glycosyltransferase involved in cell wall biosynthesis
MKVSQEAMLHYSTDTPLVSILMTAYNRQAFIGEAIESVIASTYQNWELIICDDCSTDETFEIAKNYSLNDSRIRAFKNEKNLGDYPNRNKAASHARGEFMVIVDSDDWMFKESLIKWIAVMKDKNVCFGMYSLIKHNEPVLLQPAAIISMHFFKEPVLSFGPIATIIRTSYFKSINGFPEKYGPANDMYYNLKAAAGTQTLVFPYPLVNYRVHAGQELNNKYGYLYNNYRYLKDALQELNLPLTVNEILYLEHKNNRRFVVNICKYLLKTGQATKAMTAIRLSHFRWKDFADAILTRRLKK